ncbi:MAG TPA: hypothetical protein VJC15_00270 [Candidatus Paceibacterota bacterium]
MFDEIREKQASQGSKLLSRADELSGQFFFHWSLLIGATMTLFTPFIFSLLEKGEQIEAVYLIKVMYPVFIFAMIASSLRNFVSALGASKIGKVNLLIASGGELDKNFLTLFKLPITLVIYTLQVIAILGYIIGLVLVFVFILSNLP